MKLQERILNLLSTGQENSLSLETLINATGVENRTIRKSIEQLRRSGTVIISDDNGYYFPSDISELRHYVNKEKARCNSIDITLKSAVRLLAEWGDSHY